MIDDVESANKIQIPIENSNFLPENSAISGYHESHLNKNQAPILILNSSVESVTQSPSVNSPVRLHASYIAAATKKDLKSTPV